MSEELTPSLLDAAPNPNVDTQNVDPATPPVDKPVEKLYAGKYKTVDELEKGYNNSRKEYNELKAQVPAIPENYDLKFLESKEEGKPGLFNSDDPLLQKMVPVFKTHGLSQKQVEGITADFHKFAREIVPQYDPNSEMEKLGERKQEVISKLAEYAMGIKDEKQQKIFKSLCGTAEECEFLLEHLKLGGSKPIPDGKTNIEAKGKTVAEAQEELDKYRKTYDRRIGADAEITAEYRRLLEQVTILKNPELKKELTLY